MLPENGNIDDLILDFENNDEQNTLTFGINIRDNIIGGKIDGLDALRQSIYLMLNIESDQYIIYPYTYGINTLDLIGKPYYYVMAVLPSRIKETLMRDSRITDVTDFEFKVNKNMILVKFVVHSIYGNIAGETGVKY